jgi:hypothetical protein
VVPGYYGLIWVRSHLRPKRMAENIESVLERHDFRRNLTKEVNV